MTEGQRRGARAAFSPHVPQWVWRADPAWAVLSVLLVVAAAVFGSYAGSGGFNGDDWAWAAIYKFPQEPGFFGAMREMLGVRPLAGVYLTVVQAALGMHAPLHIMLALALAAAVPFCFFLVLREIGLTALHSGAIAVLALLFPFANAPKFWATGGLISFGLILYLLGLLASLRSIRTSGLHSVLLHLAASALYVGSILTYEIATVAILAGIVVYAFRSSWPRALRHWLIELLAVVPTILYVWQARVETQREVGASFFVSTSDQLAHLKTMVTQTFSMIAPTTFPYGQSDVLLQRANEQELLSRPMGLWPLLAFVLLALATIVARRAPADDARALHAWLLVALGSLGAIAAAYLVFVPSTTAYTPLQQGMNNRTNTLAALPWSVFAYSLAMLVGLLIARATRRSHMATPVALVLCAAVAVGYVRLDRRDAESWTQAHIEQSRVLAAVKRTIGAPPRDSIVYALIERPYVAPNVRVFVTGGDLASALRATFDVPALEAVPVPPPYMFDCTTDSVKYLEPYPELAVGPQAYGDVYIVDVARQRSWALDTQSDCRAFLSASSSAEPTKS